MVLESIVNSDLNIDNVSIKELEEIVVTNRNKVRKAIGA